MTVCETDLNSECQGNPKVPYYHPSTAWHKLAPLLDHQSLVSTLKPHLYLYSFNQGELLDADWRSDEVLTARQTEKQRDDNKKNEEKDGWWVDSFSAQNTVKFMVQHAYWWTADRPERPIESWTKDQMTVLKEAPHCYPIPKELFGKYASQTDRSTVNNLHKNCML